MTTQRVVRHPLNVGSAKDMPGKPSYLTLIAAKLNLNATAPLSDGACSDFKFDDKSIQDIIDLYDTEAICNRDKKALSSSNCFDALNVFNNSLDTGLGQTRPSRLLSSPMMNVLSAGAFPRIRCPRSKSTMLTLARFAMYWEMHDRLLTTESQPSTAEVKLQ